MAARREHDPAVVHHCQELYVIDGLTLAEVAARAGVPARTVQRWSAEHGWSAARGEYRKAEAEIRAREVLARAALLERVITEGHAQAAFGFASLQNALIKSRQLALKEREAAAQATATAQESRPVSTITSPAEAVAVLQEVIQAALGRMLADPQAVSLARLRDLRGALELVDELQAKYAPENGSQSDDSGLSAALMARIQQAMRPEASDVAEVRS